MVSGLYFEMDGQVFESHCQSFGVCPRCYRMFMRHMTKITVDLSGPGESLPTPPATPKTPRTIW